MPRRKEAKNDPLNQVHSMTSDKGLSSAVSSTPECSEFTRDFFSRDTVRVARELLGARLCKRMPSGSILTGILVEVEAYTADDPACHAFKGKTKRCEVMFGPPGFSYVYFIYGMYHCLNVVTEPDGVAGAVLIRAVEFKGANGPGKLCREWAIGSEHNGLDLLDRSGPLWLEPASPVEDSMIESSCRIGISVAKEREWRFCIKDHPDVSGRRKKPSRSGS